MDYKYAKYCVNIADRIIEHYGTNSDIDLYPDDEKSVVLVITSSGIIENGGFEYLFESNLPGVYVYRKILAAFETIKANNAAKAIKRAYALFPNNNPDVERNERIRIYGIASKQLHDECDKEFYRARDEIYQCLAKHIKDKKLEKKY